MSGLRRIARAVLPRGLRNVLRRPEATLRWAWAEMGARLGRTTLLEPRPGWTIRSHPGAHDFAYHAQHDDPEQVAEFDQFLAHCTTGMVLYDIGAHFGLFSLAAAHYGGPTAQAVAVDPSPLAARVTRYQVRVNRLEDRVQVIQASVGAVPGQHLMVAAGIGSAGYFVEPTANHPTTEQVHVEMVTIDSLVATTGLRPTHIKVDVEGFEGDVLPGAAATLTGPNAPLVFLELHADIIRQSGGNPRGCLDLLASWGYEFSDVAGQSVSADQLAARSLTRLVATQRP